MPGCAKAGAADSTVSIAVALTSTLQVPTQCFPDASSESFKAARLVSVSEF
jgi:hypothetical protein